MKMINQLENNIVQLDHVDEYTWSIVHKDVVVGKIYIDENRHLQFYIEEPYRQQHYASNAVYLYTPYLHKNGLDEIVAVIQKDQEDAKHVIEHNGYTRINQNETVYVYHHVQEHTKKDDDYSPNNKKVIYLAGGCFWGMERVFKVLDGVSDTVVGYANGNVDHPTYELVCRTSTGYKETVRVTYDPSITATSTILQAYFMCIDPTVKNQQAHDIGEQYQTGIYYRDDQLKQEIAQFLEVEKQKYDPFCVEFEPLRNFYEAEEYHQNYLEKIPDGYCHISLVDIEKVKQLNQMK